MCQDSLPLKSFFFLLYKVYEIYLSTKKIITIHYLNHTLRIRRIAALSAVFLFSQPITKLENILKHLAWHICTVSKPCQTSRISPQNKDRPDLTLSFKIMKGSTLSLLFWIPANLFAPTTSNWPFIFLMFLIFLCRLVLGTLINIFLYWCRLKITIDIDLICT